MTDPVLTRAERSFALGRWATVMRTLEPRIALFRGSFRFFYLLGVSAFHLRRLPAATTYLDRAADIDPGNRSVRLYLAAALLLESKSGQAAEIYLGLLESEPRDARAAAALAFIRTGEDAGAFSGFGGGMRLAKLLPRDRGGRILRRMIAATVFAVVVAAAAAIVFMR